MVIESSNIRKEGGGASEWEVSLIIDDHGEYRPSSVGRLKIDFFH